MTLPLQHLLATFDVHRFCKSKAFHLDAAEGGAQVTEESDEDLEADKRRAQLAARSVPTPAADAHITSAGLGSHQDSKAEADKAVHSHDSTDFSEEPLHIRSGPSITVPCVFWSLQDPETLLGSLMLPNKHWMGT